MVGPSASGSLNGIPSAHETWSKVITYCNRLTQLYDVRAAFLQCQHQLNSVCFSRISCSEVWNESDAPFGLALLKRFIERGGHGVTVEARAFVALFYLCLRWAL